MPGMPIFQDSPSQLKGQIYVLDSTNDSVVPLQVDNTGNLAVNGTIDLADGAEVALAPGAEVALAAGAEVALAAGTEVALAAGTEVALAAGTEVALAAGTEVALAAGTEVTLAEGADIDNIASVTIVNGVAVVDSVSLVDAVTAVDTITNDVKIVNGATPLDVGISAGTNLIGKVESELVFTNLDAFGEAVPLTTKTVDAAATETATSQNISKETSYNWFIKNTGTAENQNITLVVELSPDGTNWIEDTGTIISVPFGASKMITVTNFLQFARFVITGGAAQTTVISSFQAQH